MTDPYLHRFLVVQRDPTRWGAVLERIVCAHKREIHGPTGLWSLLRWDDNGKPHPVAEFPIGDLAACVCLDDLDNASPQGFLMEHIPPF